MTIKQKFETAKDKTKKHAPEIILAAVAIAASTYAIILKINSEEKGKTHLLQMDDCCWDEVGKGGKLIWHENGCTIDLKHIPGSH